MPTPDALDDDLEEDDPDPLENRDLNRTVRKLAAAVLVRAVLDSKLRDVAPSVVGLVFRRARSGMWNEAPSSLVEMRKMSGSSWPNGSGR